MTNIFSESRRKREKNGRDRRNRGSGKNGRGRAEAVLFLSCCRVCFNGKEHVVRFYSRRRKGARGQVLQQTGNKRSRVFFCASCGSVLNFLRNFCFKEKQNPAFCAGKAPVSSGKNKPHRRSPGEGRGRKKSAGRAGHRGIVPGIVPQADGVRDNLNG